MTIKEYLEYHENEILDLYRSVGWTGYTDQLMMLKKGFEHSLLVLAAYENEELVGILRAVGDGYTIVFIQDILVKPAYQHRGIGSCLVEEVLKTYSNVRQIELATDNTAKTCAFYKSLGFSELSELGCCGFMRI